MEYWKIFCMEDRFPDLWRRWFEANCVALGWGPGYGFRLDGAGESWTVRDEPRRNLLDVIVGDRIVVHLPRLRVGRIGVVLKLRVQDHEWNPLVSSAEHPDHGEFGRRILVRWDPEVGPPCSDQVVKLPENLFGGALRRSIARIGKESFRRVVEAMKEPVNWVQA
jgi:hypothetical protein